MTGPSSKQLLQALLTIGGGVAIATGIFTVAAGADGVPGDNAASASVESELRFFAVFWIAYGVALLRVAPRVDTATWAVRALVGILFVAGLARGLAWAMSGRPHGLFVALMVIELVAPPLIVVWQSRLAAARSPSP